MSKLYDILVKKSFKPELEKRIRMLENFQVSESELADLKNKLNTGDYFEYYDNGVNDIQDRRRIIDCMHEDLPQDDFKLYTENTVGLLCNADNVRYAYSQCELSCPEWFIEKYDEFLKK